MKLSIVMRKTNIVTVWVDHLKQRGALNLKTKLSTSDKTNQTNAKNWLMVLKWVNVQTFLSYEKRMHCQENVEQPNQTITVPPIGTAQKNVQFHAIGQNISLAKLKNNYFYSRHFYSVKHGGGNIMLWEWFSKYEKWGLQRHLRWNNVLHWVTSYLRSESK